MQLGPHARAQVQDAVIGPLTRKPSAASSSVPYTVSRRAPPKKRSSKSVASGGIDVRLLHVL
eukprot:9418554-Karenia_brevis.AAC.2